VSLNTGSRLGPHEIIGLLGAGGMGEVYLAQDTKLNRRVAIKVLPEAHSSDPERISRFHREAQAVAALNHPAIAGIYDLAEADGIRYLVLELIEGETLADRIRRGPVPVEEALKIGKQILEALEIAHEKGICHRDLKPANVKLTPDGSVKVLDFGLAKFLIGPTAAGNLTHSPTLSLAGTYPGLILGTAGYMSPEQAKGLEADQRSDIFSFGCILYELLTGRQAFEGETASEILASVLKSEADLTVLPPKLNPRLVEMLRRCLEKNPKKRWHAAGDVRVEIESVMGRAVVDEPPATAAGTRPLWQRALAATAFTLVGALLAGYAAWTFKPEPSRSVTRFMVPLPESQAFTNTGRQLLALSPDGANLVYVANNRLFLRSMSGLEAREIAGTVVPQGILNPVFSPDGQSIVFHSVADRALKRISVNGGAAITICPVEALWGLSWEEEGIFFGQMEKGILRVSPNGGTPEVVAAAGKNEVIAFPQMLPGSRALLYTIRRGPVIVDGAEIVVQPINGSQPKIIIKGGSDARYLPTGHVVYAVQGVLFAVPFDVARLEVTGGPVPIIEGLRRGAGMAQFVFSRTGSLAYVPGPVTTGTAATSDLALFDFKGGNQPLKLPAGPYRAPRVSRDGKMIAFESEDDTAANIMIYQVAGGTAVQRFTFGGKNRAPVWSPDSEWIAFQSDREGDVAIFQQRADGSGTAERLTKPEPDTSHIPQSWSPDGAHLLFSVQKGPQYTLWILTLKDRRISPYSNVTAREAVFSPDGRWVAYHVSQPGNNTTFVEPFPATGAKYQFPTPGGHPFWSPKGDAIVVNTSPTTSSVAAVTTTPRFGFGPPQPFPRVGRQETNPLTGRRMVDMMPDGEHVLGVLLPGTVTTQEQSGIHVVLNWFDEVRQRVAQ
jgi:Tol biopolymer transport system component